MLKINRVIIMKLDLEKELPELQLHVLFHSVYVFNTVYGEHFLSRLFWITLY